ncbi:hypothetical protein BDW59DRAFT_96554 [Aspergillus cavernicola]|uniref:Arrestin-like N-terminal domain-containing protein n=1 Tax=Aspergillus cavernicola TaxID=176166 RepID=A0ABR4I723_9EURO
MLIINLSDSNATYGQGDVITGQVIYQPGHIYPLATQPVRVLIEVTGRTKTKISDSTNRYGRADLFWIRVAELYGSQTVWPFTFPFPARASPVDPSVVDLRSWTEQVTTVRSDHVLPPTFTDHQTSHFVAAVEYRVKASVWSQSQFGPAQILCEQSIPIIFRPRDDPQHRFPTKGEAVKLRAHQMVQTDLLLSETKNRDLTLREKTRSFLRRSQVPYFRFQVQLTVPLKVHLGAEIPCILSVTPTVESLESSTVTKIPPFKLTGFSIRVKGKTKAWATTGFNTDLTKSYSDIVLDKSNKELNVVLSPASDSSKVILSPAIRETVPTFVTYNIARTYVLRLQVDILCANMVSTVSEDVDLVVLPGIGDYPSSLSRRGAVDVLDVDDLPAYTEAVSDFVGTVLDVMMS